MFGCGYVTSTEEAVLCHLWMDEIEICRKEQNLARLEVYLKSKMSKMYVTKLENEYRLSNSHLHRTFQTWVIKCWSLIENGRLHYNLWCHSCTTLIAVSVFICFFSKISGPCDKRLSLSYCCRLTWQYKPYQYNLLCKQTWSFWRSYKPFNFKRIQKQRMWVVQARGISQIIVQLTIQVKWVTFDILHLSSKISYMKMGAGCMRFIFQPYNIFL